MKVLTAIDEGQGKWGMKAITGKNSSVAIIAICLSCSCGLADKNGGRYGASLFEKSAGRDLLISVRTAERAPGLAEVQAELARTKTAYRAHEIAIFGSERDARYFAMPYRLDLDGVSVLQAKVGKARRWAKTQVGFAVQGIRVQDRYRVIVNAASDSLDAAIATSKTNGEEFELETDTGKRVFTLASWQIDEGGKGRKSIRLSLLHQEQPDCAVCPILFQKAQEVLGFGVDQISISRVPVYDDPAGPSTPILVPFVVAKHVPAVLRFFRSASDPEINELSSQVFCRRIPARNHERGEDTFPCVVSSLAKGLSRE